MNGEATERVPGPGGDPVPSGEPRRVGRHEILGEIARGGMGVVYRARDLELGRVVALKAILAGAVAGDEERRRFRIEAEAAAGLDHPNILPVYEVGEDEGRIYFTMKLVAGPTLAGEIPRLLGDRRRAARLVARVARAVDHAHHRAVLHRDLKPANVLLDGDEPMVADFGLARRLGEDRGLTRTGWVLGTAGYMSPEQARGEGELTTASDVYALGAILYETLTGEPPFRSTSPLDFLVRVQNEDPVPPRRRDRTIPRDLETIAMRALARRPEARYRSAAELADDLERWLAHEPIVARSAGPLEVAGKWVRRHPMAALLVGFLALGSVAFVAGLVRYNRDLGRALNEARRAREASDASLRAAETRERELRRLHHATAMNTAREAWQAGRIDVVVAILEDLRPAAGQEDLRGFAWNYLWNLTHSELHEVALDAVDLAADPAGDRVLVLDVDGRVHFLDLETGEVVRSSPWPADPTPFARALAVDPDGGRVATAGPGKIRIWNPESGTVVEVGSERAPYDIEFTAGPTRLAVARAVGKRGLALLDPDSGRLLHEIEEPVDLIARGPGARLVTSTFTGRIQTRGPLGAVLLSFEPPLGDEAFRSLASERDGAGRLALGAPDGRILVLGPEGGIQSTLTGHAGPVLGLAFAPGGARLASAGADGGVRLWSLDEERCEAIFLGHRGQVDRVVFAGNGRRLVSSDSEGAVRIWDPLSAPSPSIDLPGPRGRSVHRVMFTPDGSALVLADAQLGSRPVRRWEIDSRRWVDGDPGWTSAILSEEKFFDAGGGRVAIVRPGGRVDLVDLDGRALGPTIVLPAEEIECLAASRDGRRLAAGFYELREGRGRSGVLLFDPAGTEIRVVEEHRPTPFDLAFGPDGRMLAGGGGRGEVLLWDATGRRTEPLVHRSEHEVTSVAVSPDGRSVAVGVLSESTVWGSKRRDGPIAVLDPETAAVRKTLRGHATGVLDLTFHPGGRTLASAGADRTVRLWDLSTGREVFRFDCPRQVDHVQFSPDGSTLAAAFYGEEKEEAGESVLVRLWRIP